MITSYGYPASYPAWMTIHSYTSHSYTNHSYRSRRDINHRDINHRDPERESPLASTLCGHDAVARYGMSALLPAIMVLSCATAP